MRLAGVLGPLAAAAALALLPAGASAGMYPKNSPVLQVDAKSFDRLIAKSNYTSVGRPPRELTPPPLPS
jgi:hypothetical protein